MRLNFKNLLLRNLIIANLFLFLQVYSYAGPVEVKKIWDKGPHNAFTDLIRYKSYFYCTFREGNNHVPKVVADNGKIRVIRSKDGKKWESVALLTDNVYDLRDPKISITPENKLMLIMGGSHYENGKLLGQLPHVSFSDNGTDFLKPIPVSIEESARTNFDWIWKVTWNGNNGYGVVYQRRASDNKSIARLLVTNDGRSFRNVKELEIEGFPNEATIRFDKDNNMMILIRRDEKKASGMLGISSKPYVDWKWTDLGYRLGGPDFLVYDNDRLIIGTRLYLTGSEKMVIYLTNKEGKIRKSVELPSGGNDASYPGLVIYGNCLWISYYSDHEGKTSIYFAKMRLRDLL